MALTKPFAENGNKTTIPATTSDGSVSYDQGFGSFYALPPEEGGLFIDRAQFNQLMYDTTSAIISNQNSIKAINNNIQTNILSTQFEPIKLYNEQITKTIGDGGDFLDLTSAFQWALEYRSKINITFKLISDIEITTNLNFYGVNFVVLDFQGFKIKGNSTANVSSNFIKFEKTQLDLYKVNIEDVMLIVGAGSHINTFNTITARRTIAKSGQYALFQALAGGFLNIYSYEEGVIDCGGFEGSSGLFATAGGAIARTSSTLNLQINNANGANASALRVIQGGIIVNTRYFKTTGSTNQTNIAKNVLAEEGYIL